MRRLVACFSTFFMLSALLGGCDKCGDSVKLNAPWGSKTCYGEDSSSK
jgi:hypothetical protein